MTDQDDAVTLAVLGTKLDNLTVLYTQLATTLTDQAGKSVPRTEWTMRNEAVNGSLSGLGREIGELRTELRSRRVSWPAVAAVAVAGAALLLQLINALGSSP